MNGRTEQQQLDLPGRLLAVLPQVPVDHLAPLHGRLVLGAECTSHGGGGSAAGPRDAALSLTARLLGVGGGSGPSLGWLYGGPGCEGEG